MSLVEGNDASEFERIQRELLYQARSQVHGQVFTGDSAIDLALQLQDAARNMVLQQRTSDDDLAEARRSVILFLDRMVVERDARGYTEFHEITVASARDFFCPGFWPFC